VAPFAPAETRAVAVSLLRILAFATVLLGASAVLSAFLYARRRFVLATLAVPAMNVVIMLVVALGHRRFGIHALAYGTVAGAAAMTLLLVPGALARPRLPRRALLPQYRRFFALFAAFVAGTVLFNVNALVERVFASTLAVGGMSNLDYGFRLVQMVFALLAILPTYLFPRLCELAAAADRGPDAGAGTSTVGALLSRGIAATLAAALPVAAFVWAAREPLVATAYQRGAFDHAAMRATADLVGWYALGLGAHALNNMVVHGFYALGAVRVRVVYASLFLCANAGANWVLVERHGAAGLAIANGIAAMVSSAYLLSRLYRRAPAAVGGLRTAVWKSAVVASLVAASAGFVASRAAVAPPFALGLAALAAAGVVWIAARIVGVPGIADLWGALFKARVR
jgi:putative peptidoglycan lipid II flippase